MRCEKCGTKDLLSYSTEVLEDLEKHGIFITELYNGDLDHCLKCGGMLFPDEEDEE